MEVHKPIKRSKELVPLSKEHHEGLLFVWKIRQGLRNGTDLNLIGDFVQWYWKAELQEHFRKEEEILLPQLPKENEMVLQMLDEHQQIEAFVQLSAMVKDADILLQLADDLYNHIRFEERVFFPFAEKEISPEKLAAIHPQLLKITPKDKWENSFWLHQ